MFDDNFSGVGGSYVLDKNGLRVRVEGTTDKLEAPAVAEAPSVVETAPSADVAPAKEK